jgi:beta-lactam-binding protein with PASTA domain
MASASERIELMTSDPVLLGGRYELGEWLGRGGMAEVRRAIDTRLGRRVAVKQLRADLATDPTFRKRFQREAQSAASLNHSTIVSVYDTGEELDPITGISIPYIVMELVQGRTLRDVLSESGRLPPERALELMQGVLDALAYSHQAGIIHRDIKPTNVMVTPTGGIKVMDFGIARAIDDSSAGLTRTAGVIGTAQYLSPEQARGEIVDGRSDIYSAGCLLYELLVGRPPFVGDSQVSLAYQHVREAPVPPSQRNPEITPDVEAITLKALAKDPADRYQSAAEMKADISRVLAGEPATAVLPEAATTAMAAAPTVGLTASEMPTRALPPPSIVPAPADMPGEKEPEESRTGRAILITALIIAVLGGVAYAVYRITDTQTPPPQIVEVPNVLTYSEQKAREQLTAQKLDVELETTNGDADTKGTITAQNPAGGTRVEEGSTVTITLNEGPKTARVPDDLVGKDVDEVQQALNDAGFTNVDTVAANTDDADAKPGEVLSVAPRSGSTVPVDNKIRVTYATGKSEVPNFSGLTKARAISRAQAAGFPEPTFTEQESTQPANTVIAQNPRAGTEVDRDTVIKLTLAKAAPPPTTAPPTTPPPTNTPSVSPSASPTTSPS